MKNSIKIIFVEDVLSDAELIWHQITKDKIPFTKKLVENEPDFKKAIKSFSPDLIISDYSLPQFDGKQALAIRNKLAPTIPFILVTGSINEEVAVECMKDGADDYILKEKLSRLGEAIKSALIKKQVIRQKEIAETMLLESEERYKTLVNHSPDGIIVHSDGKILFANEATIVTVGAESFDQIRNIPVLSFVHPDFRAKSVERIKKILETGEPSGYAEAKFIKLNGEVINVEVIGIPINYMGKPAVQTIVRDISSRKNAEEKAILERKMLRTLIDNLPDPIYILDAKCRKVIANKADVGNIGYTSEEETLGKTDLELFPGKVGVRGFADNEQVIKTGIPIINREESFTGKNGNIRWLLTTKFPLYDQNGNISGLVGIGHDITERKSMEEKVKESETYYRTLVDLSPDGTFISDLEGTINYCSKKVYEIFSIPQGMSVTGTSILEWVSPDYHEIVMDRVSKIQAGEISPEIREYKLLKYDKSPFWAELSSSPINNAAGNPEGLLVICRDVTERKRVETELVRSKEKAEESDRLKTAFLHNISHEIRTPMNAIVGFTALLSEPGVDIATMNSYIEVIMHSSNHLLAIINDIIDISSIEANTVKVVKKDVDINGMIRGLYQQFIVKTDEKKIDLSFDVELSDKDAIAYSDGTKLQQIITNFISNAIKFTAKGGIKFGYSVKDNFIRFFVTDTGIGIPREHQERIFDRFYQVENPVSKLYEGTGLGLAISKAYAELLGGNIELSSLPGNGSTFFFTMPFDQVEDVVKEAAPEKKIPDFVFSIRKRILIAEDIESNFKLLTYFLTGTNSELIRAVNGKEAVEKSLSEKELDLILMDIKMPVMDGFTATRIIRESNKTIPIIAQTAYSEDREKALEYGCTGFIAKPFDRARLITVLKEALL
jgi:PAS domain S-box-containing protein